MGRGPRSAAAPAAQRSRCSAQCSTWQRAPASARCESNQRKQQRRLHQGLLGSTASCARRARCMHAQNQQHSHARHLSQWLFPESGACFGGARALARGMQNKPRTNQSPASHRRLAKKTRHQHHKAKPPLAYSQTSNSSSAKVKTALLQCGMRPPFGPRHAQGGAMLARTHAVTGKDWEAKGMKCSAQQPAPARLLVVSVSVKASPSSRCHVHAYAAGKGGKGARRAHKHTPARHTRCRTHAVAHPLNKAQKHTRGLVSSSCTERW